MDPISGIISLGGGLLSNIFAGDRQKESEEFQAQQAQNQMNFQKEMRATAYQTAVTDMKAAGLNPMMMGGINTSTPSGAMAGSVPQAPVHDPITPALQTAMQSSKLSSELNLQAQQTAATAAQADKNSAEANESTARAAKTMSEIKGAEATSEILTKHVEQATNDAITAQKQRPYLDSAIGSAIIPTARAAKDIWSMVPKMRIGVSPSTSSAWSMSDRFNASFGN